MSCEGKKALAPWEGKMREGVVISHRIAEEPQRMGGQKYERIKVAFEQGPGARELSIEVARQFVVFPDDEPANPQVPSSPTKPLL